ncbi:hypothetical protein CMUST_04770 [Corynebacterium mustelae]|uniref:Uncharacterized protein n=1 Tax=Corynebacterium mustelae TaxID=571915 RepID=A0A0G3H0F4_9CORY|nr:hypothetical protein [Corynebacterium mustelae]AKK05293.1 hypothetical protein CMUST_04770 [Corynebacterium mustelae]
MKRFFSTFNLALFGAFGVLTFIPYSAWQLYSFQPYPTENIDSGLYVRGNEKDALTFIAPMAGGNLAEISYGEPNVAYLMKSVASYGGMQIEECLHDQSPGASLMYDGTLLFTDYCFAESQKSLGARMQSQSIQVQLDQSPKVSTTNVAVVGTATVTP